MVYAIVMDKLEQDTDESDNPPEMFTMHAEYRRRLTEEGSRTIFRVSGHDRQWHVQHCAPFTTLDFDRQRWEEQTDPTDGSSPQCPLGSTPTGHGCAAAVACPTDPRAPDNLSRVSQFLD